MESAAVITPEDIVGMTDLTPDEVAAIAERAHTIDVLAAGMVEYLMHRHGGPKAVNRMICEDIRERCTPTISITQGRSTPRSGISLPRTRRRRRDRGSTRPGS